MRNKNFADKLMGYDLTDHSILPLFNDFFATRKKSGHDFVLLVCGMALNWYHTIGGYSVYSDEYIYASNIF